MFSSLAHRDFRLVLLGTFGVQFGQWTQQIGRGLLAWQLTKSEFQLGLVTMAMGLAMFLAAPIGGVLSDRFDRRKVIMVSQACLMANSLATALLVALNAITLSELYVLSFTNGALFAFNGPSRQAIIFEIVGKRDLPNAIALNSVTMNAMRVIGPAVGGIMVATVGIEGTFYIQSGGYVVSLLSVVAMRHVRAQETKETGSFLRNMADGLSYIRRTDVVRSLLIVSIIGSLLGTSFVPLMPAYVDHTLHLSDSAFGYLMASLGGGAMLGSVFVAATGGSGGKGMLLIGVVVSTGALLMVLGGLPVVGVAAVALLGLGFCNAVTLALCNTLLQINLQDVYRGRVMSIYFLTFGLSSFGSLALGSVAEAMGLRVSFVGLGIMVLALIGFVNLRSSKVRRLG